MKLLNSAEIMNSMSRVRSFLYRRTNFYRYETLLWLKDLDRNIFLDYRALQYNDTGGPSDTIFHLLFEWEISEDPNIKGKVIQDAVPVVVHDIFHQKVGKTHISDYDVYEIIDKYFPNTEVWFAFPNYFGHNPQAKQILPDDKISFNYPPFMEITDIDWAKPHKYNGKKYKPTKGMLKLY